MVVVVAGVVVVVVGAVVVAVVDGSDAVAEVVAVVPVVEVGAPDVPVVPDVEVDEVVEMVDAWWVEAPATATPMPTAATVAVSPIVTVARRMRTSAASRERVASFVWRGSGGRAMGAPFVQVAGRRGLPSFDAAIPPGPGQSTLDAT